MAPTAQLADKRKSKDLEMCQLRVEVLKDKVEELTKERDYLKEQLAAGKFHYTQFKSNFSTLGSYFFTLLLDAWMYVSLCAMLA